MTVLQKKLFDEIFEITEIIQKKFPELYKILSETPLFSSENQTEKAFDVEVATHYLEALKGQLAVFEAEAMMRNSQK